MRGITVKLAAARIESHLFIVVSNPHPQKNTVLAFNLTDLENYPDCSCVLQPGEHEYITIPSAVRYFSPKFWDPAILLQRINDGTFKQYENASEEVLEKIINGAYHCDDLPPICLDFLPPKGG